jgi:benzoyl-CoA 2,3-dioxygenase component B
MVYLLHAHFGRDGRDEADALLERRSGDEDQPRILDAFNQPCEEWLSFFCFTAFTDRDGKYQLGALAESAFDPLARTCRFMLTEEAHHLFVGETGLARIVRRSAQLMKADPNEDPAAQGGIPLDLVQRYINYWFSFCLDLFGSELSTTAGDNFMAGLKGRWREAAQYEEHTGRDQHIKIPCAIDGKVVTQTVALVTGINEVLRSEYVADCEKVVARLNKVLVDEDVSPRLRLPHRRFHRRQGLHAHHHFDLDGELLTDEQWERRSPSWLPQPEDDALLKALMVPVHEPGKMANWISPPRRGIKGKPAAFEYVMKEA